MSKDLTAKRYLVIADYPGSQMEVGFVVTKENCLPYFFQFNIEKYPHLFRELQWWEMREESEMPEYVKWNPESILYKNQTPVYKTKISDKEWNEVSKHCNIHLSHLIPATPEEYSEYIKSK